MQFIVCVQIEIYLTFFSPQMKTYAHNHTFTRVTEPQIFYVFAKHPVECRRYAFLNLVIGSFIAAAATHCKVTGGPFHIR